MRIPCPFCGERDSSEFTVSGDANVRRPDGNLPEARSQFFDAVYLRDNPAGRHTELWYHGGGCRSWLRVNRDTRSHEVFTVTLASEVAR
ncbi:MAG TPA: sarcosine oxidase subunit delta [Steroidobacter sp.]|uniref:sarcosine oxidase subunit delta n=1 Tax=Steroidobacter sp. TaxID=1978227 RepID=UPI002ED785C1